MAVHAGKLRIGEPSTTISQGSTLQAFGSGNGLPLTGHAEGEEIVFARSERKW